MPGGKPQARIGDSSMGHWVGIFYFPPTVLTEGSNDTFSCCIPASRVGDKAAEHMAFIFGIVPLPSYTHEPEASTGAPCKYINNKQAFRVGDSYDCGDTQAKGCVLHLVGDTCG